MIKDRVIQKRIKGKVLAMAMTAVVASFFVPLGVEAAQTVQTSQRAGNGNGNLILTDEGYYWEKSAGGADGRREKLCKLVERHRAAKTEKRRPNEQQRFITVL